MKNTNAQVVLLMLLVAVAWIVVALFQPVGAAPRVAAVGPPGTLVQSRSATGYDVIEWDWFAGPGGAAQVETSTPVYGMLFSAAILPDLTNPLTHAATRTQVEPEHRVGFGWLFARLPVNRTDGTYEEQR